MICNVPNRGGVLGVWMTQAEYERARETLRRLHHECSFLRRDGKYLNRGPMMEPSEEAILEARALLAEMDAEDTR